MKFQLGKKIGSKNYVPTLINSEKFFWFYAFLFQRDVACQFFEKFSNLSDHLLPQQGVNCWPHRGKYSCGHISCPDSCMLILTPNLDPGTQN